MAGDDSSWQAVLDSLEDGYYECDLNGTFINVNRAFNRITEYSRDEIIRKNYKDFYTQEDADKIYRTYHDVFVNRKQRGLSNSTVIAKSGRKKDIESSISLIWDTAGRISGFRGIIRDISEKKRMEKELFRARKLEAIGILAGGIAHDYNNALTAILGNISLAKMEVGPDDKNLLEVLNDAEEASLKAVELTRHLSTFARGGKPEREVINYKDSLRIIVDNVLSGYSGTYELVVKDELWSVDIDEFQINQVITYILNNAVESMAPPGIVRIIAENTMVENEESHHEITLQPGKYVRISIHDEGIGIPAEDIHNIFDPYFTTKEMSSGMGLATSYAIIKRHHGYIDVKSSPGKGSTFFVYLPVAQ
jgi:two-component system, cell cycle sensor histidine kinase and response regulator CckA